MSQRATEGQNQTSKSPSMATTTGSQPKNGEAASPKDVATQNATTGPTSKVPKPAGEKTAVDLGGTTAHKTAAEQRSADWKIVKNLASNLWPDGWGPEARSTKGRIILALGLLAGGKVSVVSCWM